MKRILQIIALYSVLILGTANSYAQDGAQLFKAKCNTCHMVDKNSTGPLLKGVKQKWNDAGEGDFLYEWVKNPQTLIATGKSKVALEAKNFSPTEMSPQAVSNEEIDAIYIPVPTGLRTSLVFSAAKAKKHVLAEKPFLSSENVEEMRRVCQENGVMFMGMFLFLRVSQR